MKIEEGDCETATLSAQLTGCIARIVRTLSLAHLRFAGIEFAASSTCCFCKNRELVPEPFRHVLPGSGSGEGGMPAGEGGGAGAEAGDDPAGVGAAGTGEGTGEGGRDAYGRDAHETVQRLAECDNPDVSERAMHTLNAARLKRATELARAIPPGGTLAVSLRSFPRELSLRNVALCGISGGAASEGREGKGNGSRIEHTS